DALQGVLPGSFRARVEESVLLETPKGLGDHPLFPDVRVVEYTSKRGLETRPEAGAAWAAPLLVDAEPKPITEPFLDISGGPCGKVPLLPGDADVPLDVQALVEQCYRNGGYEGTLNYAADPGPLLFGADKEWAEAWLHEKGLRPRKKPPRRKGKSKSR